MVAVVLAAGRGTRMGKLTATRPKPLVEVAGRPLLAHVLSGLAAAGLDAAVVVVGHLGEMIEDAIGDGSELGIVVRYHRQARLDGTAGALLTVRAELTAPFLVTWADVYVEAPTYARVVERFAAGDAAGVLATNDVDDPWAGAAVYVDDSGWVTRIVEKPRRGTSTTRRNNAGVLALDPVVFEYVERLEPSARGELELPQAIAAMVGAGLHVAAVPVAGPWRDVGTPADRDALEAMLAGGNTR